MDFMLCKLMVYIIYFILKSFIDMFQVFRPAPGHHPQFENFKAPSIPPPDDVVFRKISVGLGETPSSSSIKRTCASLHNISPDTWENSELLLEKAMELGKIPSSSSTEWPCGLLLGRLRHTCITIFSQSAIYCYYYY